MKNTVIFITTLIIFFLFVFLTYQHTSLNKDIYIFSEGFLGCVTIVYEVKNSESIELDDMGNRIFKVPNNGILEVNSKYKYGTSLPNQFYFRDSLGQMVEFNYIEPFERIGKYPDSTIVASIMEYGTNIKPYKTFIVSEYRAGANAICDDRYRRLMKYLKKYED